MNELLIRVSGTLYENAQVTVNGQKRDFKKNNRGSYEFTVNSDGSDEIEIVRNHELASSAWLIWGLLFFVISCFGIFDVRYSKAAPLKFCARVTSFGNGTVQLNPDVKRGGCGVAVADNELVAVDVTCNELDAALIKRRLKTLRIIKLLLWIALIAAIVSVVVL